MVEVCGHMKGNGRHKLGLGSRIGTAAGGCRDAKAL